jgi:hypothetical protein
MGRQNSAAGPREPVDLWPASKGVENPSGLSTTHPPPFHIAGLEKYGYLTI